MKKLLSILFCALMLVGCKTTASTEVNNTKTTEDITEQVEIEDFTDKTVEEAIAYFDDKGIDYIIGYYSNDYTVDGIVLSQTLSNNCVLLTVSKKRETDVEDVKFVENEETLTCDTVDEVVRENSCTNEK